MADPLLNPDVAAHLPVFVVIAVVLAGLVGSAVAIAFRVFFLNEKRIERIVRTVVTSTLASPAFSEAVRAVAETLTAQAKADLADLRTRDNERAEAIRRAHERIDALQTTLNAHVIDIFKRLPAQRD